MILFRIMLLLLLFFHSFSRIYVCMCVCAVADVSSTTATGRQVDAATEASVIYKRIVVEPRPSSTSARTPITVSHSVSDSSKSSRSLSNSSRDMLCDNESRRRGYETVLPIRVIVASSSPSPMPTTTHINNTTAAPAATRRS